MITEKIIAKEFNGLWEETLPLLTPSFVRLFNEANSESLTDLPSSKFKSIPISPAIEKHDLVAEFSFQLAKLSKDNSISISAIKSDSVIYEEAFYNSIKFLKKYSNLKLSESLNEVEIAESYSLADQYVHFFSYIKANVVEFSPRIAGSGFLGVCEADLSVDDTLYEIKTVSRNFAGRDIKQLIIYLALQHSTGTRRWLYAGFFNPRKSLHYKFSVDHLIYRTSGGRSTSEVFKDIIDFLESRGIEIDAIF
jgi:uncharacterized protein YlxP (DUF503 family)